MSKSSKNILIVIPFENVYPPMNGGMMRCFNLLNQLCKNFSVTAIMHQDRQSFSKAYNEFPALKSCHVISTKEHVVGEGWFQIIPARFRNALKFRIWNRSLKEPADSNYLMLYPPMKEFLQKNNVDCVILEDMAILGLSKLAKRFYPHAPVIYDAYNVNSALAEVAAEKGIIPRKEFEFILNTEKRLYKNVENIFTCSENDLIQLKKMNEGKIGGEVIPNGVEIPGKHGDIPASDGQDTSNILFCGSLDYLPNQEGLLWFCKDVFPKIVELRPDIKLLVVGKGNPGEQLTNILNNPHVTNYGRVESVAPYYEKSALAVIPLLSGSGTRLKLLESMAFQVPVVSTSNGAEGINYRNGVNIAIADTSEDFAQKVIELMDDRKIRTFLADNAFKLVKENYDWDIVGMKMKQYLMDGLN